MEIHRIRPDITVLNDATEVPGIGYLPINSFVLHAAEPVVVDTGLGTPDRGFIDARRRSSTRRTCAGSG